MDISIPQNLEDILKEKVTEGIFKSIEEAVSFAVRFTFVNNTQERIDMLNAEIEKGWQEMENSKGKPYKDVFSDLRKRYA